MKTYEIVELLKAKEVHISDDDLSQREYTHAFSSDLMSDCLALITKNQNKTVLLTGLCNIQSFRTAEMLDIELVIIVRGKKLDQETLQSISDFNTNVFSTDLTMFEASGLLYANGMRAVDYDENIYG